MLVTRFTMRYFPVGIWPLCCNSVMVGHVWVFHSKFLIMVAWFWCHQVWHGALVGAVAFMNTQELV